MWNVARDRVLRPAITLLKAFCAYQLTSEYVGGIRVVDGPSMLPTFSATPEWIIEDILSVRLGRPLIRGEVVVFNSPRVPHTQVCKRVIGLPGDVVCVDPTDQRRNGMADSYVTVPEGHVWIAGDNAAASRDSRDYGPVPIALVRSRVFAKFYPWRIFRDESRIIEI